MTDRFVIPGRLRNTSLFLIGVGLLTLIVGIFVLLSGPNADIHSKTRFWIILLHDSVFFVLITAVSVFIQAAASLAQGSWIVAYKRVPEAIGANVWVFSIIAAIIMFSIIFGFNVNGHNTVYPWVHPNGDKLLEGKSAFLNPGMYVGSLWLHWLYGRFLAKNSALFL